MKTYDKLKKKDKDKLNTYLLYGLHHTIEGVTILLCIYILAATGIIIMILGDIFNIVHLIFYSMILFGGMLLIWVVYRINDRKVKEKVKRYFGIENIEKDIFKDGER